MEQNNSQQLQLVDRRLYAVPDYEEIAKTRNFRFAYDYYNSGANDEVSLRQQYKVYRDIKLKTKVFPNESKWQGTQTQILGTNIDSPICVTSTAFQRMANPEGECATAKACNASKTPMVLSSWANSLAEDVSQLAPDSVKVYQVYLSKFDEVNQDIWDRLRKSGFKALALTCDTQLLGKRLNDTRNRFSLPHPWQMANFTKYTQAAQTTDAKSGEGSGLAEFAKKHKNNEIGWDIIPSLKRDSGLKVFAKGIMCKEDARLALENGVDGIYVSNHGARQLDTTPATIEVLSEIANEAELYSKEKGIAKVPIWFDGGIRHGSDILKALAKGADIVWIGRPVLWGLACEGQKGVENIVRRLNEELKEAMIQCGCYSLNDIKNKQIIYDDNEVIFPRL